jgi:YHS domain-containing protein
MKLFHWILAASVSLSTSVFAGNAVNADATGVAAAGHDVVAYFEMNKPVPGDAKLVTEFEGAKYQFSSVENLNAFKANPAKFAPQYGGFCAFAAAFGQKASIDPTQFKVVGGKLYLNKNPDVSKKWSADIDGFVMKADKNWPQIKDK